MKVLELITGNQEGHISIGSARTYTIGAGLIGSVLGGAFARKRTNEGQEPILGFLY